MIATRRIHFVVRGHVQGVAFRAYTCRAAAEIGVTGFVRNRPDGEVEGEAQGAPGEVERFTAFLRDGSPWARVDDVELEERTPIDGEPAFDVRR